MQKTLSLAIGLSLLFTLNACQPKPEAPKVEAKTAALNPINLQLKNRLSLSLLMNQR